MQVAFCSDLVESKSARGERQPVSILAPNSEQEGYSQFKLLRVKLAEAKNVSLSWKKDNSHNGAIFARVVVNKLVLHTTGIASLEEYGNNPYWNENIECLVQANDVITFEIWGDTEESKECQFVGQYHVIILNLQQHINVNDWFLLQGKDGERVQGYIHLAFYLVDGDRSDKESKLKVRQKAIEEPVPSKRIFPLRNSQLTESDAHHRKEKTVERSSEILDLLDIGDPFNARLSTRIKCLSLEEQVSSTTWTAESMRDIATEKMAPELINTIATTTTTPNSRVVCVYTVTFFTGSHVYAYSSNDVSITLMGDLGTSNKITTFSQWKSADTPGRRI
eukprot:TRINITY_DN8446_c0_g1_i6.p1 TRINITY_DN8446_c0_g1~~TRINITY_DN8446_c0_g1_i6.p1  ORF type:complete len:335 (+),score=57.36 TRINITY_DN8446_c0_g1_i6:133-1137(+)